MEAKSEISTTSAEGSASACPGPANVYKSVDKALRKVQTIEDFNALKDNYNGIDSIEYRLEAKDDSPQAPTSFVRPQPIPIPGRDGCYLLPSYLSHSEQFALALACLRDYLEPPNKKNTDTTTGKVLAEVWPALVAEYAGGGNTSNGPLDGQSLRSAAPAVAESQWTTVSEAMTKEGGSASDWFKRICWATLGYHYDWTRRAYYDDPEWRSPFPQPSAQLGADIAALCGFSLKAEAGIVNYYRPGRNMGGHKDDLERTFDHPVVSVSLGCSAVFLLGGLDKSQAPIPILLHSGDAVVMGGAHRLAVHGVSSILPSTCPSYLLHVEELRQHCKSEPLEGTTATLKSQADTTAESKDAEPGKRVTAPDSRPVPSASVSVKRQRVSGTEEYSFVSVQGISDEDLECFGRVMSNLRVNVNVRQVDP